MERERSAILLSAATNAGLALLGIGFGVWVSSSAILLDGIFNGIAFGMALLSLRVARLVARPPDETFPFGYGAFEPMTNTVKALIVVGASIFALIGAVSTIVAGGRTLDAGRALIYAALATLACSTLWLVQRRAARVSGSPLLRVDAENWFVNALISSAVGVAFLLVMLLKGTGLAGFVPYADSVLVVAVVLLLLPIPARKIRQGLAEVLGYAPPPEFLREAHAVVDKAIRGEPVEAVNLRLTRMGRTVFLLAEARVPAASTLAELEELRARITARLLAEEPNLVMDLVFRAAPA